MKTNKSIDDNLVKQFQSGNANALTELVKRWHKQFCEKAYWIVKDGDLSKDIAQDCWRVIIDKIHDLKDPGSFGSWSMRIVYSKSLDTIRASTKKRIRHEEFAYEQTIETVDDQEDDLLKNKLLKAVKRLSEQQQIVLNLFYVEAYSIKQISSILNISIGTTKSRLFHAREKLKKVLKNK